MGNAGTTSLEEPFVGYAEINYENAYAIWQYLMDLLHAIYWFQAVDYQQTELYLTKRYTISTESGFYMPFVECGEQGNAWLHYVKDTA